MHDPVSVVHKLAQISVSQRFNGVTLGSLGPTLHVTIVIIEWFFFS